MAQQNRVVHDAEVEDVVVRALRVWLNRNGSSPVPPVAVVASAAIEGASPCGLRSPELPTNDCMGWDPKYATPHPDRSEDYGTAANVMMKRVLQTIFERVARGPSAILRVVFADSTVWQSRPGEPTVTIHFRRRSAQHRTVLLGYVGFFEAYFEGDIEIVGDRAVGGLMHMAFSGAYRYGTNPLLLVKRRYLEWRDSNHDFARAKANARHHYGLPFEFFRLMLGDDCLYAEGYWLEGTTTLAEAQRQRCDYICRKLLLMPGDRLVEVGSGWGGMAIAAAEKYGADVVNYGLVPEQNRIMQARLEQRGLTGRVRIVERDHRDLMQEPAAYDRYLSVVVLYEHAGFASQPRWIESIATALKPGGIGMISSTDYVTWAVRYRVPHGQLNVFPGGNCPQSAAHTGIAGPPWFARRRR